MKKNTKAWLIGTICGSTIALGTFGVSLPIIFTHINRILTKPFADFEITNVKDAKQVIADVNYIYTHASRYGLEENYRLFDESAYHDFLLPPSIAYTAGGGGSYPKNLRNAMWDYAADKGMLNYLPPFDFLIWCELSYDIAQQFLGVHNFVVSSASLTGFTNPDEWYQVNEDSNIGGTAKISMNFSSGVQIDNDGDYYVEDLYNTPMKIKYVNDYFTDMGFEDYTATNIYDRSLTFSFGCDPVVYFTSEQPSTDLCFTERLSGIGECGFLENDENTGGLWLRDSPTRFWFNTSFFYQNLLP